MSASMNARIAAGLHAGDQSAWEELYDVYSTQLWKYVAKVTGSQQDFINEVIQETFYSAASSAKTYRIDQGTLWAWLTGIAHREIANWFRRQGRADKSKSPEVQSELATRRDGCQTSLSPPAVLMQHERQSVVREILTELTTEYAVLLTAKYMEQLSIEEIQLLYGGSSNSIRSKLKRARAEFRKRSERYELEETES